MSWLAKSLVSTFNDDNNNREEEDPSSERGGGKGVKEDLSELTKSFTRQLWGVASFLAPPPTTLTSNDSPPLSSPSSPLVPDSDSPRSFNRSQHDHSSPNVGGSPRMTGIRNDLSEISGRFRSGISILSSGTTMSGISKLASSFLPFASGDGEEDSEETDNQAIGITEEVLTFVSNISKHPETWLDFPLLTDHQYADDFEMSDAQKDHALAVERLAPSLTALRLELCSSHISEGCFWKIYFVLLHSCLSKHDAELLSTPQIIQARSTVQELQSRTRTGNVKSESSTFRQKSVSLPSQEAHAPATKTEASFKYVSSEEDKSLGVDYTNKLSVRNESRFDDKAVVDKESSIVKKDVSPEASLEDEGDEWLEETAEISGPENAIASLVNEEDVSFSDLEDDGDDNCLPEVSKAKDASDSSVDGSKGWIQLSDIQSDDAGEDGCSTASSRRSDFLSGKGKVDPNRTGECKDDWLSIDDMDDVCSVIHTAH